MQTYNIFHAHPNISGKSNMLLKSIYIIDTRTCQTLHIIFEENTSGIPVACRCPSEMAKMSEKR
jgi:hypothetical protein